MLSLQDYVRKLSIRVRKRTKGGKKKMVTERVMPVKICVS